jgi:hypothetical protein
MLFRCTAELPVKFFVTSRPEPTIRDHILSQSDDSRSIFAFLTLHVARASRFVCVSVFVRYLQYNNGIFVLYVIEFLTRLYCGHLPVYIAGKRDIRERRLVWDLQSRTSASVTNSHNF